MNKVFISYRRADSESTVGRMYDRLVARYGKENIFKDVDEIPYGEKFARYISSALEQCNALLAVIGPAWLTAANADGSRRLDDPDDFVRMEIETALARDIMIIPIVVQGASLPRRDQLPESLRGMLDYNVLQVRGDPDFSIDIQRLTDALDRRRDATPVASDTPPLTSEPAPPVMPPAVPAATLTASYAMASAPTRGDAPPSQADAFPASASSVAVSPGTPAWLMKLHPIWRYGLGYGAVLGIVEAILALTLYPNPNLNPSLVVLTLMSLAAACGFFLISHQVVQRTGNIGYGVVAVLIAMILVTLVSAYPLASAYASANMRAESSAYASANIRAVYSGTFNVAIWGAPLAVLILGGIPGILIALAGGAMGKWRWTREHSVKASQS